MTKAQIDHGVKVLDLLDRIKVELILLQASGDRINLISAKNKLNSLTAEIEDMLFPTEPDPIIPDFEIKRVKGNPPKYPERSPSHVEAFRLTRDGSSIRFIKEQE